MNQIERIEAPNVEYFREHYLRPSKPVIMTGITDNWPAMSKWSESYLTDVAGDRLLNVTRMTDGDYVGSQNNEMSLGDYLTELRAINDDREKIYLAELPLADYIPELIDDIVLPTYFDETESSPNCFLYAGRSVFSQMHYHIFGSALLSPIRGYKKVRLVAPDQTRYLYKYPWYSSNSNMSKTVSLNPDKDEFPDFTKAKYIDLELKQGESLFIPIYWWHAITNEEFNIAVVIFWGEKLFSRMPPRQLVMDYLYDQFKEGPAITAGIIKKLAAKAGIKADRDRV